MLDINVNGVSYSLEEIPGEKLSDLLRLRFRLTGTKVGCGEGRCGICTVLMDGKPVRSCITRASKAHGKSILPPSQFQTLHDNKVRMQTNSTLHHNSVEPQGKGR